MDPLAQIAAIKAAYIAQQTPVAPATPTTNYVTPDVESALTDLQNTVTPSVPAPAPAQPA